MTTPRDKTKAPGTPPEPPRVESPQDLRRSPRVHVNREFASIDAFLDEYVTNISKDGVFIRTDSPLPIGTRVNLRFSVILDEVESLEGVGEVVRVVTESGHERGMGVVFVELSSFSEVIIQSLFVRPPHPPERR